MLHSKTTTMMRKKMIEKIFFTVFVAILFLLWRRNYKSDVEMEGKLSDIGWLATIITWPCLIGALIIVWTR